MNEEELKTKTVDELIAVSQEMGRQVDTLREQRQLIANLIREKLTVAAKIADLEQQLATLKGQASDATAPGAVVSATSEG